MITTETIMATRPCESYPSTRVSRLIAQHGPFPSWEYLAVTARDAGWPVIPYDIMLTAYRAVTPDQRDLGARRSTRVQVHAQIRSHPDASPEVATIRDRLLAWADGGSEAISDIRRDASAAHMSAPSASSVSFDAACAADAAAAADAYANAEGDAAPSAATSLAYAASSAEAVAYPSVGYTADAAHHSRWRSLIFICHLLDRAPLPDPTGLDRRASEK